MPSKSIHCKIDQRAIARYVKEQRALGDRITLSDTECRGLKLAINNQSASWTYAYRKRGYMDGGKRYPQVTMKLGDPVTLSPVEARLETARIKSIVAAGGDPAVDARKAEADRRHAEAQKRTCAAWLHRYATDCLGDGSTKHQRDEITHVRLGLQELAVADSEPEIITARLLRDLIDQHADRPATARHRFGAMSRFLDYLLDEEAISNNPATSVSKRRRPKPPAPRTSFYGPEQLAQLWNATGLKPVYLQFLRFMIATPLRASEGANLRWDQLDRGRAELRFAASETKNDEAFVMPLNSLSLDLLGQPDDASGLLVFQLSNVENGTMKSWSHFHSFVRVGSGLPQFKPHDLRRTFSTLMSEHTDVSETIVDSLLNHKQSATRSGVMRHYQHAKNLEKRRSAMTQWQRLLEGWV